MTTPVGLELVWANAGGSEDPGNSKYQLGWVAEIPTFENFNYVLQALDKAKLAYAESDIYKWQDFIAYIAGARVVAGEKTYYCITPHNDSEGSNPQNPLLDTTNSYWVNNIVFSSLTDAFTRLKSREGLKLEQTSLRLDANSWGGNDLTIENKNAIIALNKVGKGDNLLFGNVDGKLVVVDVKEALNPDGRDLRPEKNKDSFYIYHEGNKPKQEDVVGTIPRNPEDGKLYARRGDNWEEVSTTTIGLAPPPPVKGAGAGWYNLEDGRYYLDINDGDSSQWVPASPPVVPELVAKFVDYDNKDSGLKGKNVQDAIDEITKISKGINDNLIINGDFSIWQRGQSAYLNHNSKENSIFFADRFLMSIKGTNSRVNASLITDETIINFKARTALYLDYSTDQSIVIRQVIEQGKDITDDEDVTVSFWLYIEEFNDLTGDGFNIKLGDEEARILFITKTGWNLYSHTFSRKIRNKAVDNPHINFDLIFGGMATIGITYLKLELSKNNTQFKVSNNGDTLRACQRYYYQIKFNSLTVLPMTRVGVALSRGNFLSLLNLPETMVSVPWITMYPEVAEFTFWNIGTYEGAEGIVSNIRITNQSQEPGNTIFAYISFSTEEQDFAKYKYTGPFASNHTVTFKFDSELR